MRRSFLIMVPIALLMAQAALGQGADVVPDVTGMSVPAAAAALNRVGIAIGHEVAEPLSAEANLAPNTVISQSLAPGTQVEAGAAIDLTIQRSPNTLLIYDDNDLTLVNQTGSIIDLSQITFQALDGNGATFAAGQWGNTLRESCCAQIWSIHRTGPKDLNECPFIEHWLATTQSSRHFWTGAGGTTQFSVLQNGIERGVCMVTNPGRCEVYLPGNDAGFEDVTEYVYIVYSQDRLAIINNTNDHWMPLSGLVLLNNFVEPRGQAITLSDAALYGDHLNPAADLRRLAPGQCILFTNNPETQSPPQPCDVIAWLAINPSLIFWGADFPVDSVSDNLNHTCPAAKPDQMVLCIMPR